MQASKITYIAETDDNGNVVFVWVDAPAQQSTRPFNPSHDRLDPATKVDFFGAASGKIKDWINSNTVETPLTLTLSVTIPAFTAVF